MKATDALNIVVAPEEEDASVACDCEPFCADGAGVSRPCDRVITDDADADNESDGDGAENDNDCTAVRLLLGGVEMTPRDAPDNGSEACDGCVRGSDG